MAYNFKKVEAFTNGKAGRNDTYVCKTCPYCNGERDATVKFQENKPPSMKWYKETLGDPKYVVAPMVDQSELPFRQLCREYGATLCYSPMFNARCFVEVPEYRERHFTTCPEDKPLFVQLCGNEPDMVLAAARLVENDCDAVDLNLGCPQGIAKRGFYGSYLMEHWDIIHTTLHTLAVELKIPVTAKMRIFDGHESEELTLQYAKMLKDSGAHLVAVHGRTREMKGMFTGIADLEMIRKVREHIGDNGNYPVIANGNIMRFSDIDLNIKQTGCNAGMSAEALLWDPKLFSDPEEAVLSGREFHMKKSTRFYALQTAKEYLDYVVKYPVDLGFVKAHLFKLLYHSLEVFPEMREELTKFDNWDIEALKDLYVIIAKLKELEETTTGNEEPIVKLTAEEKLAIFMKERAEKEAQLDHDLLCMGLDDMCCAFEEKVAENSEAAKADEK